MYSGLVTRQPVSGYRMVYFWNHSNGSHFVIYTLATTVTKVETELQNPFNIKLIVY
jgi:hypothetical protein